MSTTIIVIIAAILGAAFIFGVLRKSRSDDSTHSTGGAQNVNTEADRK